MFHGEKWFSCEWIRQKQRENGILFLRDERRSGEIRFLCRCVAQKHGAIIVAQCKKGQ